MQLSPNQYRQQFIASELAAQIKQQLKIMENDPAYNTLSSYTPNQTGNISFADKHFAYISINPKVKPSEYMSNLRLMTKIKS